VVAIAKWLSGTLSASAIPVAFARFNGNCTGGFLGDMGFVFGHVLIPQNYRSFSINYKAS